MPGNLARSKLKSFPWPTFPFSRYLFLLFFCFITSSEFEFRTFVWQANCVPSFYGISGQQGALRQTIKRRKPVEWERRRDSLPKMWAADVIRCSQVFSGVVDVDVVVGALC